MSRGQTLKEIGAGALPHLVVLNKIDGVSEDDRRALRDELPEAIQLCAFSSGDDVAALRQRLIDSFDMGLETVTVARCPMTASRVPPPRLARTPLPRCSSSTWYLFHIVSNHPFVGGNKRAGLLAAQVSLDVNGIALDHDSEAFYDLTMGVSLAERAAGSASRSSFTRER